MTDHATWARGIVMAIDLTTASAVEGSIKLIDSALTRAAEEAVREMKDNIIYEAAALRGVERDEICGDCNGLGVKLYGSTATWRGGIGGQAMTSDVCDKCWGSGNKYRTWINLRTLSNPNLKAAQPVWSKEKPTVAGGYWRRDSPDDETPFPTLVYDDGNDGLECNGVDVLDMGGEWAGPIQLPREA